MYGQTEPPHSLISLIDLIAWVASFRTSTTETEAAAIAATTRTLTHWLPDDAYIGVAGKVHGAAAEDTLVDAYEQLQLPDQMPPGVLPQFIVRALESERSWAAGRRTRCRVNPYHLIAMVRSQSRATRGPAAHDVGSISATLSTKLPGWSHHVPLPLGVALQFILTSISELGLNDGNPLTQSTRALDIVMTAAMVSALIERGLTFQWRPGGL